MLEPRWTNFLLNCPPNRDGLMDATIVSRLAEVGAAWSPNQPRPVAAAGAHHRASVHADQRDRHQWHSRQRHRRHQRHEYLHALANRGALPQSVTLDLGQTRPDVGMLTYLPQYSAGVGIAAGGITDFGILVSTDGTNFTQAASGSWLADGSSRRRSSVPWRRATCASKRARRWAGQRSPPISPSARTADAALWCDSGDRA